MLIIDDVIEFDNDQMKQLKQLSKSYTQNEMRNLKVGFDLVNLKTDQHKSIIEKKEEIVSKGNRDPEELIRTKLIRFSSHSMLRSFQRVEVDVQNMGAYLTGKIIEADFVYKAQYKGYPQLSYTLMKRGDKEYFKSSISFIKIANKDRFISVMTISQNESSKLNQIGFSRSSQSISENSDALSKLEELKRRLQSD